MFLENITHDEQRLFTLLFINNYEGTKKLDKSFLIANIPDMTKKGSPQKITGEYMDQILEELLTAGHIRKEEPYYYISDAGIDFLKKNNLLISPEDGSSLLEYIPQNELRSLLKSLANALNTQIGIMNERVRFFVALSDKIYGICDECIRCVSAVGCKCSDLLAAIRAKDKGTHSFRCPAGFVECISPIKIELEVGKVEYCYIFLGRIIPADLNVDRLIQYCRERTEDGVLPFKEAEIRARIGSEKRSGKEIENIEGITHGIAILLSAFMKQLSGNRTQINMLDEVITIGADVPGHDNIDDILKAIMKAAKRIFKYDGAAIWKLEPDLGQLHSIASDSGLPDYINDPVFYLRGDGFESWIAREEKPLLIGDVFTHIESGQEPKSKYPKYVNQQRLGSFLGVPLVVENNVIGVLEIEKRGIGEFTGLDQELLTAIAKIAGIAINRTMLLDVLNNISTKKNLIDLLNTAVTNMPGLLGAGFCSVFLFDAELEKLVLRATNSPALKNGINQLYYDEENPGLTWHVANTGNFVVENDVNKNPLWKGRHKEADSRVYLGYPLKDRAGEGHGVIRFTTVFGKSSFNKRDEKLASILSNWLSLAIDRIELDLTRRNTNLLLRIEEIHNTASSIDDLLEKVADAMKEEFGCESREITLFDKDKKKLVVMVGYELTRKGYEYSIDDRSLTGQLALKRKIINDKFYDADTPGTPPPGSRLGIPLLLNEELFGTFKLANKIPTDDNPTGEFTQDDETTARIIASEIARTIRDCQERINVALLIQKTDELYMRQRDAEKALIYMADNVGKAIDGSWASLYRWEYCYDIGQEKFIYVGDSTIGGAPPEETMNAAHIWKIYKERKILDIPGALNSEEHQDLLKNYSCPDSDEVKKYIQSIGSEYAIPLKVGDRFYGAFFFYKQRKNGFTLTNKQSARDLADRASLLLESHELLEARRKLHVVSSQLQKEFRLIKELQKSIVEGVHELGYDRARLYLISSDGKRLESVAQVGLTDKNRAKDFEEHKIWKEFHIDLPPLKAEGPKEFVDTGLDFHALQFGKPVIYVRKDSKAHNTIGERYTAGVQIYIVKEDPLKDNLEREGVDEWLDFPLIALNVKLGKITVDNRWSKIPFSRVDCEILGLFGQYAAQALLNALDIEKTVGFGYGARGLAHNIKNRVSGISLFLDLMEMYELPEEIIDYIKNIRMANDSITRHVNAMRKAVELEKTEFEVFTVKQLMDIIWKELEVTWIVSKGVVFKLDIPQNVLDVSVSVDKDQIVEVFLNLYRNSLEAMEGEGNITVSAWLESDYVYITWEDDGPGIPEEHADNLFTIGFTTKSTGTGTGLFSSKRMMLRNGGDIEFDRSLRNKNGNYRARFVVKIPLLRGENDGGLPNEGGPGHADS